MCCIPLTPSKRKPITFMQSHINVLPRFLLFFFHNENQKILHDSFTWTTHSRFCLFIFIFFSLFCCVVLLSFASLLFLNWIFGNVFILFYFYIFFYFFNGLFLLMIHALSQFTNHNRKTRDLNWWMRLIYVHMICLLFFFFIEKTKTVSRLILFVSHKITHHNIHCTTFHSRRSDCLWYAWFHYLTVT